MNKEIYKIVIFVKFMYFYYLITIINDHFRSKYIQCGYFYTSSQTSITKTYPQIIS